MLRLILVIGVMTLAVVTTSTPSMAQLMCGKRIEVVNNLRTNYQETVTNIGLVNNGLVLEVLSSKSGTWTILVTKPNGVACVMATGDAWEIIEREVIEEERNPT